MELARSPYRDAPIPRDVAEALARERERVHAWLHDSVLQVLELIAAGGYSDDPDPEVLARLAANAADELRAEIDGREPAAGVSLTGEIMRAVHRERARSLLPVRLEVGKIDDSEAVAAPHELSDAIAEALRNAAKHADATMVTIHYELIAGVAMVVIADDGVGFDPARRHHGTGLSGSIVGRLRRAGGWATIDSKPGGGTRIVLGLPLTEPAGDLMAVTGA